MSDKEKADEKPLTKPEKPKKTEKPKPDYEPEPLIYKPEPSVRVDEIKKRREKRKRE